MIEITGLTKTFRRGEVEITVLNNVSLSVTKGELVSLMGPSGSGKSTLLNILAGIDSPTSGKVVVNGADLNSMSDDARTGWRVRNIGYVFQFYNLIPVLTAYENVELPLLNLGLSRADRRKHVKTAIAAVGVEHREEHYPRQLSGGEEQRVTIARAIATR
ncbi:MAG: ABC transporter ATP-binding protein, partial [Planctomycetota bacterium]|nr:ABC transporter ATP-binding protein [Planctomycetota bacterium]